MRLYRFDTEGVKKTKMQVLGFRCWVGERS
jgi:hypothetical protein